MTQATWSLQSAIAQCWECRTECIETLFNHCLQQGGRHVVPEHVKIMTDCIQACQTAADFMTRRSAMHMVECNACADVCDACAVSCDAIGGDIMRACAETCRACAASCRTMSQQKKAA